MWAGLGRPGGPSTPPAAPASTPPDPALASAHAVSVQEGCACEPAPGTQQSYREGRGLALTGSELLWAPSRNWGRGELPPMGNATGWCSRREALSPAPSPTQPLCPSSPLLWSSFMAGTLHGSPAQRPALCRPPPTGQATCPLVSSRRQRTHFSGPWPAPSAFPVLNKRCSPSLCPVCPRERSRACPAWGRKDTQGPLCSQSLLPPRPEASGHSGQDQ